MWRSIALFCFTILSAGAQTIDATSGPWSATLDGTWRWHPGDDMRWAAPSFDDSNWPALRVPGPLPPGRQYWIRLHVQLGAVSNPGLLLGPIGYAYDVYCDGQRIGSFGDLSRGKWFMPRAQIFPLSGPLATPGAHAVAVRIGQIDVHGIGREPRASSGESRVGDVAALREAQSAQVRAGFEPQLLNLLVDFGFLLAGLYFLLLPPSVSQGTAFRWLGVILLSRGLLMIFLYYSNFGLIPIPGGVVAAFIFALASVAFIGLIDFSYALFRRRVSIPIRGLECLLLTLAAPVPLPYSAGLARLTLWSISPVVSIALASAEFRRRTLDAGFTLILLAIFGATTLYNTLDAALFAVYHVSLLKTQINIAGFWLWDWELMYLLWVPAITMQIYKTTMRLRDERERLRGEMEAARQVQELLIPPQSIKVPGFDVEASYRPATEVGGDFFQLFPAADNSLLVVVGDVSGKGMKAALVVSVIAGALRNRKSDVPAAVLSELNMVLLGGGQGGFTTCCCALFSSDGNLAIASAGHLAPYRNGEEMASPPGLPLGIDGEAEWPEVEFQLQPGDRLVFVSDGVVEARNGKGELLGFQGARDLASRPASEIARAAQQFGQEDDITVVSITRQPVPVYVA